MGDRYARTSAGQSEIQSRALNLPRHVRNLLLVIQPAQPGSYWLEQVRGCAPADLEMLVAHGLIEAVKAPAAPPAASRPSAAAGVDVTALLRRVRALAYEPLYDALNAHAKESLGLIGGYRFVLEIERCTGAAEVQALALRYVEQMRDKQDEAGLRRFAALLPR